MNLVCVCDVSLLREVLQPGGSWSSSVFAPDYQVECDAALESIFKKEKGLCSGLIVVGQFKLTVNGIINHSTNNCHFSNK